MAILAEQYSQPTSVDHNFRPALQKWQQTKLKAKIDDAGDTFFNQIQETMISFLLSNLITTMF